MQCIHSKETARHPSVIKWRQLSFDIYISPINKLNYETIQIDQLNNLADN